MFARPLILRADASVAIGTGHAMRCLALAQAWRHRGGTAIFVMAYSTPAVEKFITAEGMAVLHIEASPGSQEDTKELLAIAQKYQAEWVVLDGYSFDQEYSIRLKQAGLKLAVIDDGGVQQRYAADVLINQNVTARESMYLRSEIDTKLLLGTNYAMLRREFESSRHFRRDFPVVGSKILVTMGGSDPQNISGNIIRALRLVKLPFEAKVIIGGSNPHGEALESAVRDATKQIELIHSPGNMPELMAWADIAISAAGSTCWELCLLAVPSIVVDLAPNQLPIAEELDRLNCAVHLRNIAQVSDDVIAARLHWLMMSPEIRRFLSYHAHALVDGRGAARVVSQILSEKLRLRPVGKGDCRLLWEWANDPDVRTASFSSAPIGWEQHESWFAEKMRSPHSRLFIAIDSNNSPVGLLRFDVVDDSAVLSINLIRQFRGMGYGSAVLSLGIAEVLCRAPGKQIIAYIKPENLVSLRLFASFGFRASGNDIVNGQPAIRHVFVEPHKTSPLRKVASETASQRPATFAPSAHPAMTIAICQPTYLPWLGYFSLIDQVDAFVLLDDVQFQKQSWQQRNRIKTPLGLQWLTVPVIFRGRFGQLVKDVEIRDIEFWRDHSRAIELNYRRTPFFEKYFSDLKCHLSGTPVFGLANLNVRLIEWLMEVLGIRTPLVLSSHLKQTGKGAELLAKICRSLGATQYVSPLGSAVYLLEKQRTLSDQGIDLVFQNYDHPVYDQLFPPFIPYASVVDLLFNEGDHALDIIRQGRRAPYLPSEVPAQLVVQQSIQ